MRSAMNNSGGAFMKKVLVLLALFLFLFTIAFVEIFCIDEYVKPDKEPLSSEQQEIADRYYELMLREYPSFKAIPREMLSEAVYQGVDGYMSVKYTFCLGGIPTDCYADFSKGPDDSEGKWYKSENIFMKYYSTGLTEKQMTEMRAEIENQILQLVDEYKLKREGMEEETVLYWRIEKGRMNLIGEYLAPVIPETVRWFPCGDHAHLFGYAALE